MNSEYVYISLSHSKHEGYSIMGVFAKFNSAINCIKTSDQVWIDAFSIREYNINDGTFTETFIDASKIN